LAAWGNFLLDKGFNAAAAITKFRAVKWTANAEEVTPVTAITDDIAGFSQFSVASTEITRGKGASVRMLGVTEAEAAGAIAVGKFCTLEADGRVSQLVGASGKKIVGKCVGTPAVNAGDRISMLVIHVPTLA
jgi:hypothetical protein